MVSFIGNVFAWLFKNLSLVVGIVEAILKVAGGIVSLTPTKRDDAVLEVINDIFSKIKSWLYAISDKLAGKSPTVPN